MLTDIMTVARYEVVEEGTAIIVTDPLQLEVETLKFVVLVRDVIYDEFMNEWDLQ